MIALRALDLTITLPITRRWTRFFSAPEELQWCLFKLYKQRLCDHRRTSSMTYLNSSVFNLLSQLHSSVEKSLDFPQLVCEKSHLNPYYCFICDVSVTSFFLRKSIDFLCEPIRLLLLPLVLSTPLV